MQTLIVVPGVGAINQEMVVLRRRGHEIDRYLLKRARKKPVSDREAAILARAKRMISSKYSALEKRREELIANALNSHRCFHCALSGRP